MRLMHLVAWSGRDCRHVQLESVRGRSGGDYAAEAHPGMSCTLVCTARPAIVGNKITFYHKISLL